MAQMFPKYMRPYEKASKEDLMFRALEQLNDDYCVFHSVNFDYFGKRNPAEDVFQSFHQHQADFIIFHKEKGILIIEGKAGEIRFENGECIQVNGKYRTTKVITPHQQASNIKFDIIHSFEKENIKPLIKKCKFQHAVWFADITKNDLINKGQCLDFNIHRTLTFDDIDNSDTLKKNIERIFSFPDEFEEENYKEKKQNSYKLSKMTEEELFKEYHNPTNLSEEDFQKIMDKIFNPLLIIAGSESTNINFENKRLDYLLREQKLILNFLEEQNSAIINGSAGTGKTYIACEKARRHSMKGEKVLFLCYNRRLCKQLQKIYQNDEDMQNVDFYTIDKLSYKYCKEHNNYKQLVKEINYMCTDFPYKHIIIDEGQDFGKRYNETYDNTLCNVIETLKDTVLLDDENPGSFYLFYDKNQMIQCKDIPKYIKDADCKLTLYTNCRNTANIAKTSSNIINIKGKTLRNNIESEKPQIYNSTSTCEQQINDLENLLKQCIDNKIEEDQVEILTVKTIQNSILSKSDKLDKILEEEYSNVDKKNLNDDMYEYKYCYKGKRFDFTTCRKFKGLEAKVVILIDVTANTFSEDISKSVMYVGATRAKNRLYIISKIDENEWEKIADKMGIKHKKPQTPYSAVKNYLDVDIIKR